MKMNNAQEIRRAYILAKALNVQYQFIREIISDDLVKAINEAKAKNSYFIKLIDQRFEKRHAMGQLEQDEELAFQFLEQIEKI
jgi:hypothetical protein